jgi:hypothetical protein
MPDQNLADDALASRFAPVDLTTLQVYEEYRWFYYNFFMRPTSSLLFDIV